MSCKFTPTEYVVLTGYTTDKPCQAPSNDATSCIIMFVDDIEKFVE